MGARVYEPWAQSKWISKSNAAKYIHVSDKEMERLLSEGQIPASVSANRAAGREVVYVNIEDLDAYMRQSPYSPKAGDNKRVRRAAMEQPPLTESAGDAAFRKVMEREARKSAAKAARERGEAA